MGYLKFQENLLNSNTEINIQTQKGRYVSSYTHTDRLEHTATPLEAFWVTRGNRGKSPFNFYFNSFLIGGGFLSGALPPKLYLDLLETSL